MDTISIFSEKQDLASALFYVNKTDKPIQIRDEKTTAMLISLKQWSEIEETLYLNNFPYVVKNILDADNEDVAKMSKAEECDW